MKRNLAGLAFALIGGGAIFAACGEVDTTCAFDSDCLDDEVCLAETNQCVVTCESSDECFFDDECRARPGGGSEMVCQAPEGSNQNQELGCTDISDCDEEIGEVCDTVINECVIPGAEYYTVLIEDKTTGDRCDDTTYDQPTSGAKITALFLEDADGNTVGFGKSVQFDVGTHDTDGMAFFGEAEDILTGTPPDFDGQCPTVDEQSGAPNNSSSFREDAVVALGCGGKLFVQFYDENDDRIHIDGSHSVVVRTYGTFCSNHFQTEQGGGHAPQTADDPYDVSVCTDGSQANLDISSCTTLSTDVEGFHTVAVEVE